MFDAILRFADTRKVEEEEQSSDHKDDQQHCKSVDVSLDQKGTLGHEYVNNK